MGWAMFMAGFYSGIFVWLKFGDTISSGVSFPSLSLGVKIRGGAKGRDSFCLSATLWFY